MTRFQFYIHLKLFKISTSLDRSWIDNLKLTIRTGVMMSKIPMKKLLEHHYDHHIQSEGFVLNVQTPLFLLVIYEQVN